MKKPVSRYYFGGYAMKRLISLMPIGLMIALLAALPMSSVNADEVSSLRGSLALEEQQSPPPVAKLKLDLEKFERNFKTQPPLIPHKVAKYKINLKANRCLKCHDKANYKEEESPMVGKSHYVDDAGVEGDKLNMGRYFCTQCHVPQADTSPLVSNTFTGAQ
ncbi:MAG: nitrate reductase cytochrome c-type subunit [Rhodospirillales bacterium]|nr:nitrate reductase cytochrome c-type subunit [Rhodospirillales bacterium]